MPTPFTFIILHQVVVIVGIQTEFFLGIIIVIVIVIKKKNQIQRQMQVSMWRKRLGNSDTTFQDLTFNKDYTPLETRTNSQIPSSSPCLFLS
jgi:uncharacterized membrane protein affecting hemolysin expression